MAFVTWVAKRCTPVMGCVRKRPLMTIFGGTGAVSSLNSVGELPADWLSRFD